MKIKNVSTPPKEVSFYKSWDGPGHEDLEDKLTPSHVEDIVEIFNTPLTGHYNWDYSSADDRIRKLYRLGKELNWNAEVDVDWQQNFPKDLAPLDENLNPFKGWATFEDLSEDEKLRFGWHNLAWMLAQFVPWRAGRLAGCLTARILRTDLRRQVIRRLTNL